MIYAMQIFDVSHFPVVSTCLCVLTGLKKKTEQKLRAVDAKNRKLTPWQEYKEKRARKKLEKKEAKMVCQEHISKVK